MEGRRGGEGEEVEGRRRGLMHNQVSLKFNCLQLHGCFFFD